MNVNGGVLASGYLIGVSDGPTLNGLTAGNRPPGRQAGSSRPYISTTVSA
ncbi:MAG: hypothetical protein KDJ22_03960 [Candidatus Competibacteraceae bacterium]|nr:hypothetical protein [Candidatus Competibacteraceae bacterium]MCB1769564.1 hypothetical protein [Candidatus Competibacteraceae bacterium]